MQWKKKKMVKVEIVNQQKKLKIPTKKVSDLVEMVATEEGIGEGTFVLTFIDNKGITELNRNYLGRDRDTNVITFSYVSDFNPAISPVIAEIFINTDRVIREANGADMDVMERFYELIIHGVLHGLDYEHENVPEDVKREMEEKEKYYKNKWWGEKNGQ